MQVSFEYDVAIRVPHIINKLERNISNSVCDIRER